MSQPQSLNQQISGKKPGTADSRSPTQAQTVALDVGGTAMKGVVLSGSTVVGYHRWPTPRQEGPDAVVKAVISAVDDLLTKAPDARAVGLVVPGLVDDKAGTAIYSENIGWHDVPFVKLVTEHTGLPVGFGHDVRAGGLAERTFGAARGQDDVLFMPIGTGISGAMFVEGHAIANKYAGEIGHLDVGSGELCACGAIGCLETVATGPSIARRYNRLTGSSIEGAKPVAERMAAGDPAAARVWHEAAENIARALAAYVSLLAPQLIVIGGGLSSAGDTLLKPVEAELRRMLVWQQVPQLVTAALGDNAACLGAGIMATQALP
ncbi:ROK family protein [Paenarthrobacter sp. DKR-5]|uniref:ROK family protein n=1 Tax=Paenarthrobacter sp. DKR-5 TaxID=2835535 RepID=UPI001BDC35E6|nr:ROK family protein [Paenarthrobacter sp. DKR-5]MBT1003916.1 ROK family protein [Paenarthrobacter sp. DKR-5]